MTITGTTTSVSYTGDGSVVAFTVTFPFFGTGSTSELEVISRVIATGVETTQTYSTHYTVTGGNGSTGTVTAGTAPASTVQWHIRRTTTETQGTDYVENDEFPADSHENALDRLTMVAQETTTELAKTFQYPATYTGGASNTFPEPIAGAYILFNSAGTALTSSSTSAAQYLGSNGTVLLPFYSFSSDPNIGMWRVGADQLGWSVNGVKGLDLSTTGLTVTGTLAATAITGSGVLSIDDATESTSGTSGSIHTDGGLGIAKKLHVIGTTTHGGDVLSDTDSTDSLGSTGARWLKLWVDSIQTTANLDVAGNLTVTGNLTINGTTVTNDATNTEIKDPLIEINSGASSNANDLGLLMERGSTGDNAFLGWDESGDYFLAGTTTATGSSTGNITYSFAPFKCSAITATSGTLAGITSFGLNAGATITAGILDEDAMGSDSAVALATQQSIKAYTDANAPENGVKFAFESTTTDTDQGAGKVWLNNGTPSSATVLYVDDVEAASVSVNSWVDTWDDVSNAVARGYIYIASYGTTNAILVYKVTGAVTSASTYSKIAVTHVLTVGTISDGDNIGLTFVPCGEDGTGTVNSVATGTGLTGGTITTSGTISATGTLADIAGLAVTDSGFVVGDGANFVLESGSTVRTSLGLGTAAEKNTGTANGNVVLLDSTGLPAVDGSQLTGLAGADSTDLRLAFLLIAENAGDRLNMIDGIADPFKDESDVDTATSASETYDATSDFYSNPAPATDSIPDMTGATAPSGTASASSEEAGSAFAWYAFNDDTAQGWGSDVTTSGWLAYEFSSNKTIIKYTIVGGQDGYSNRAPKDWTFEGWTGSAWVVLQTVTNETGWSPPTEKRTFTFSNSTAYIKYQLNVSAINGGNVTAVIEMEMMEADSTANMTLVSNAFTADAVPATGRIHVQAKPIDSITLNTDLTAEISRDGGTTFTTATLVSKETLADGTTAYEDASVDISGQPSGTSMKWRIKTLNNKEVEVHGIVLQWA